MADESRIAEVAGTGSHGSTKDMNRQVMVSGSGAESGNKDVNRQVMVSGSGVEGGNKGLSKTVSIFVGLGMVVGSRYVTQVRMAAVAGGGAVVGSWASYASWSLKTVAVNGYGTPSGVIGYGPRLDEVEGDILSLGREEVVGI